MAEDWVSTARSIATRRQNNTPRADSQPKTQESRIPAQDITPIKGEKNTQLASVQENANANENRHRNFKRPRELKSKAINVRLKQSVFNCLQEIMQSTGDNLTDALEKAILAYHSTKQGLTN